VAAQPPPPGRQQFQPEDCLWLAATDKELDRYTRDFAREENARGMLIKLGEQLAEGAQ
jgi:hypothetical protein